jgi:segregation and condensation protein B
MNDSHKSILEALLFTSEKPLTVESLKAAMENTGIAEINALLNELKEEYESQDRGIRIIEVAGGYRMNTAPQFSAYVKKLFKDRRVERLSKPALETLAIIAYKQPLTKHQIQSIRNVNNDAMIHNLLEKNFIRITGRKKAPGRPFVYGTTREFLEYFGLKSLDELPKITEFAQLPKEGGNPDGSTNT